MTKTKELLYKKAFTEFNEVLKRLSEDELLKIPNEVINNIRNQMDTEYKWKWYMGRLNI